MKKWKIGIFGAGRGCDIARNFKLLGCEIVALCDFHPARLHAALEELGEGVASYTEFKEFIEHPMDAVVLANYFYEHAPYAIECFKRGIHVYSECISNGTMAEGVALARAAENTSSIYMLGENYPQMAFNREMKRVADTGSLGKILYAEGEYNHPGSPDDLWFAKTYCYFPEHWRNFNPATYYITHSIGPIMRATGATPKRVTAFAAFARWKGLIPWQTTWETVRLSSPPKTMTDPSSGSPAVRNSVPTTTPTGCAGPRDRSKTSGGPMAKSCFVITVGPNRRGWRRSTATIPSGMIPMWTKLNRAVTAAVT
ncbi:MAG: Gfo/Idh/MocA family oxidoreductase, partial [Clostridia bacterium]|nr:Gfo/Idh/MocA family oxidoreductase [Clostridia bacterium]